MTENKFYDLTPKPADKMDDLRQDIEDLKALVTSLTLMIAVGMRA